MTGLLVLAVAGLLLVVLGLATARRPEHEIPDRDGYFDRWQALHGGYDPRTGNAWLRGWLTMVYAIARPLARRVVQPDVLTISSIWLAGAVFVPAARGGSELTLSAVLDGPLLWPALWPAWWTAALQVRLLAHRADGVARAARRSA